METRNGWLNFSQLSILTERYLEITLSDLKNTLLLLIQAPFIAFLIVLVFRSIGQATDSLYFVLVLSALWLGCINACREIVKEKAVYLRERMVNLNIGSYLTSKLIILAMIDFIQCIILLYIVSSNVHIGGSRLVFFLLLFLVSLAGTSLGLLLSAFSGSPDVAVALVPLVIIPQILFSPFVIPVKYHGPVTRMVEKFMVLRWGYEGTQEVVKTTYQLGTVFLDAGILLLFSVLFILLAGFILKLRDN